MVRSRGDLIWIRANKAFHQAVQTEVSALIAEYGLSGAYEEAVKRRRALPDGEPQVFAYNVEVQVAELAGISTDNPAAHPLGPEPPIWFLPFLKAQHLAWLGCLVDDLAAAVFGPPAPDAAPLSRIFARKAFLTPEAYHLTERQLDCLRWAAQGKSSWDIGAILGLSPRTVDEHLDNACRKLGVKRRAQAAVAAEKMGLLATDR